MRRTFNIILLLCISGCGKESADHKETKSTAEETSSVQRAQASRSGDSVVAAQAPKELFVRTGFASRMKDDKLERALLAAANDWSRLRKKSFFAVSILSRDWKILRTRGQPTGRMLYGMFYSKDESGICHGNALEFRQDYDGNSYSDVFSFHSRSSFPSEDPSIRYRSGSHPKTLLKANAPPFYKAMQSKSGLVFEQCSSKDAWADLVGGTE